METIKSVPVLQLNNKTIALSIKAIKKLKLLISGRLLLPNEDGYEEESQVWNGMIQRRPAMIIKCLNTSDIQAVLKFADAHQLQTSIRGGGHHVAGSAVLENGIMIDLSGMKDIQLDPINKTVTAAPGVTWGELDAYTQKRGFAVPGGVVSTTGVGGLTMGGGIGWLRRKYGLSSDNLIAAEALTAKGERVSLNKQSNPDLFWAIKGGGSGLCVVSSFKFKLHRVGPQVMFCFVFYSASDTEKILKWYRDKAAILPYEVSTFLIYGTVPAEEPFRKTIQGQDCLLLAAMHSGTVEEGKKVLQPFREISTPLLDLSGPMKYVEVQQILDDDYPKNKLNYYWKSLFFDQLSDEFIEKFIEMGKTRPSPLSTVDIWHMGGAIDDHDAIPSAYPHRNREYLLGVEANWEKNGPDGPNIDWTRNAIKQFKAFSNGTSYLNFEDLDDESLVAAHGKHYEKLSNIRKKYNPENRF